MLEGVLVESPRGGRFVVVNDVLAGPGTPVRWPPEYRVRDDNGLLVLEDQAGTVITREGDHVRLGGGFVTDDHAFTVCGYVEGVAPTPTPVGQLALWTAPPPLRHPGTEDGVCRLALMSGIVARHPDSGLGIKGRQSDKAFPVRWPFGYTARHEPDGIVLIHPDGSVAAGEGDMVRFGGGLGEGDIFEGCGGVELVNRR